MRLRTFFPLFLSLLLVACLPPKALPSDEVLERTALASQKLTSLAFTVNMSGSFFGQLSNDRMAGHGHLKGVLHDQGNALEASVSGSLTGVMSGSDAAMTFSGRIVAFNQKEMYVRLDTFTLSPERPDVPMDSIGLMLGTWWHLEGNGASGAVLTTPDPTFLQAQTEALSITEDHGVEKRDGRYMYHYDALLDRKKFSDLLKKQGNVQDVDINELHVAGEVWIDAETFVLRHAVWHLSKIPTGDGELTSTISMTLSDHNNAEPVRVPTSSKTLTPAMLAPFFHPDDTIPLAEEDNQDNTDASTP